MECDYCQKELSDELTIYKIQGVLLCEKCFEDKQDPNFEYRLEGREDELIRNRREN